jgi:hypothetical protein
MLQTVQKEVNQVTEGGYGSPSGEESAAMAEMDSVDSKVNQQSAQAAELQDTSNLPDDYGGAATAADTGKGGEEGFVTQDIERARRAIAASQSTADKLLRGSRELEQTIRGVIDEGGASESIEGWIGDARHQLEGHDLFSAWRSIRKAGKGVKKMEKDVKNLRRNIVLLHRLLQEKNVAETELESVIRKLRSVSIHAEDGDMEDAANVVEGLIGQIAGAETSTLNPFLFRTFWLGVESRWPAGGDYGVLLVRLLNDGRRPLPPMRMKAPAPRGWVSEPEWIDLPNLPPGGFVHLRFHLTPAVPIGLDTPPVARRLSVMTAYEVRQGDITCVVRIRNKSMEVHRDILVRPWLPASFTCETIPLIKSLAPDDIAAFRIPLNIAFDGGHNA